jgi:hypothetical protein
MPPKPANCYIIAGPNGAGKTAINDAPLYQRLRKEYGP